MAYQVVMDSPDFKPKWTAAVEWLHEELERVCYITNTGVQLCLNDMLLPVVVFA